MLIEESRAADSRADNKQLSSLGKHTRVHVFAREGKTEIALYPVSGNSLCRFTYGKIGVQVINGVVLLVGLIGISECVALRV